MQYRTDTQLSVTIENAPGKIAELSNLLANENISLSAITINEGPEKGVFRFTANDPQAAQACLEANGYSVGCEQVLSISLKDSKGRLAALTRTLSNSGINIDYMYASVDHAGCCCRMIIKVSNIPLALRVIEELQTAA